MISDGRFFPDGLSIFHPPFSTIVCPSPLGYQQLKAQRPAAKRPRFAPPSAPLQRLCFCAATLPLVATARKKGTSGHPNAPAGAALGVIRCAPPFRAVRPSKSRPAGAGWPVPRHVAALHRPAHPGNRGALTKVSGALLPLLFELRLSAARGAPRNVGC